MYQIPPIGNEYVFEDFVCDIFNRIYSTFSFQKYGVKGQKQNGIDIYYAGSLDKRIVIQCKKKDINKSDEENRENLLKEIKHDFEKCKDLKFEYSSFILASTYKNDVKIQESITKLSEDEQFDIQYWGWETLVSYLANYPDLLKKYYPNYKIDIKVNGSSILINYNSEDVTLPPLGYLKVLKDNETYSLVNSCTYIGRSMENDISLGKMSISRKHCVIEITDNAYVTDLGSKHGTFLNNAKIMPEKKYKLKQNDEISIGIANEKIDFIYCK